jgi:hypothetical protein
MYLRCSPFYYDDRVGAKLWSEFRVATILQGVPTLRVAPSTTTLHVAPPTALRVAPLTTLRVAPPTTLLIEYPTNVGNIMTVLPFNLRHDDKDSVSGYRYKFLISHKIETALDDDITPRGIVYYFVCTV